MHVLVMEGEWGESDELIAWARDVDELASLVEQHGPKARGDASLAVYELVDGGGIGQVKRLVWTPAKYEGPLARAWVSRPLNGEGGYYHRTCIDCSQPSEFRADEPNEVYPYRVVEVRGVPDSERELGPMGCECGLWQLIEGIPDAVADMVAKYPPRPGLDAEAAAVDAD